MKALVTGAVVLGIVLIAGLSATPLLSQETYTAEVRKSERVCESGKDGSCRYLVFTDQGVFKNTDTIWKWKFNSSDFYADIEVGKTYEFDTVGFRIPFLSVYENIVAFEEK